MPSNERDAGDVSAAPPPRWRHVVPQSSPAHNASTDAPEVSFELAENPIPAIGVEQQTTQWGTLTVPPPWAKESYQLGKQRMLTVEIIRYPDCSPFFYQPTFTTKEVSVTYSDVVRIGAFEALHMEGTATRVQLDAGPSIHRSVAYVLCTSTGPVFLGLTNYDDDVIDDDDRNILVRIAGSVAHLQLGEPQGVQWPLLPAEDGSFEARVPSSMRKLRDAQGYHYVLDEPRGTLVAKCMDASDEPSSAWKAWLGFRQGVLDGTARIIRERQIIRGDNVGLELLVETAQGEPARARMRLLRRGFRFCAFFAPLAEHPEDDWARPFVESAVVR
jgi:hypothetical protein